MYGIEFNDWVRNKLLIERKDLATEKKVELELNDETLEFGINTKKFSKIKEGHI